jgi:TPR repeat protein
MRTLAAVSFLIVCLLTFSMAVTAYSGQFEDAVAAYERGDYATAYRLIKPLAQEGIPEAQYNLGLMYDQGKGVPQDYAEAVKWYRRAAEQGDANAQYNLGQMYREGRGVPQNDAEAVKWFRKAAEQGYAGAQRKRKTGDGCEI